MFNILLLFVSISLSLHKLTPDINNTTLLNENEIKCIPYSTITYKINNNQDKKYFHLIKQTQISEFALYEEYNELSYETNTDCDFYYPITPNTILYLVIKTDLKYCISFKYSNFNSTTFIFNEEYSYPVFEDNRYIQTKIEGVGNKHFILYCTHSTTSDFYSYNLYINNVKYQAESGYRIFSTILTEDEINLKIELPSRLKIIVYYKYISVPYSNITDDSLIFKDDSNNFHSYFINKPKTNFSVFWYSLSSNKTIYYKNKQTRTKLQDIISSINWDNSEHFILMKEKGSYQIKYMNQMNYISINNIDRVLISTSPIKPFAFGGKEFKNMDIYLYSTENNFISDILIGQIRKNLDIKKVNNKYFYIFNSDSNYLGQIILNIKFNLAEKEYIFVDFEFEDYAADENITLNIKEEDNNIIKEIGNKGTLEILTDHNDTETNYFSNLNIISYTFNNTMIDNDNNTYNVQCKLWKACNGKIKIFCKFDDDLINTTQNLVFSDINLDYKKHILNVKNYCKINIKKINAYIPFIYSDKQIINLDSEEMLSFKFEYDFFSNEKLFLFDNKFKSAYFDKCSINSYENEIICQISNKKLKSILSYSGEKFYLATFNTYKGLYIFETVGDIIITSNINKKDQYVQITKLINEVAEFYSFIYYETNITYISDLTSNIFDINYNNSCMFKKRRAKNENLLLALFLLLLKFLLPII